MRKVRAILEILTLPVPIPDEEKKLSQIFVFTLLCGASKGFMKALKVFIKRFEAPQGENKNLTFRNARDIKNVRSGDCTLYYVSIIEGLKAAINPIIWNRS